MTDPHPEPRCPTCGRLFEPDEDALGRTAYAAYRSCAQVKNIMPAWDELAEHYRAAWRTTAKLTVESILNDL